jgi:hypothetical protein
MLTSTRDYSNEKMASISSTHLLICKAVGNDPTTIVVHFLIGDEAELTDVSAISLGIWEHVDKMKKYSNIHMRLACLFDQLAIAELIISRTQRPTYKYKPWVKNQAAITTANNGLCAAALAGNLRIVTRMIELGATKFNHALMFAYCGDAANSNIVDIIYDKGGRLSSASRRVIDDFHAGRINRDGLWVHFEYF